MTYNKTGHCAVAYAILVSNDGQKHIAVELHDVSFKKVRFLELNGEPEPRRIAVDRMCDAAFNRSMDDHSPGWLPTEMERLR